MKSKSGVIVYSGGMIVSSASEIKNQVLQQKENDGLFVYSGGTAKDTSILTAGLLYVYDGGTAIRTAIDWQGEMRIFSGGAADSAEISSGGNMYVEKGGTASGITIHSRGGLYVYGGTANNTKVNSRGIFIISSDGTANDTEVGAEVRFIIGNGTANHTKIHSGGILQAEGGTINNAVIESGGKMTIYEDSRISGELKIESGAVVSVCSGVNVDFTAADRKTTDNALINDWSLIAGGDDAEYTITVKTNQESGIYRLADGASGFANTVTVKTTADEILGALSVGGSLKTKYADYTLNLTDGKLTLNTAAVIQESPRVNFMQNGVSQILAWDAEQGKVGYMAADGNIAPGWQGVWEWSGEEASMWKVVGAGHFSGSTVEQDGVLLYNGYGNTFAAWTNLNDGSYGYVSLCHVDGNFQTKCIADFDNNGFDDVIIYDENGSVGIVSDAAAYHDVWHVDDKSANVWQLVGTGRFHGESDSIVFKNTSNNHLYLWDNNDLSFSTWDWSQTDIGGISDGWEVAAIGDFSGDGIDDIALINHNDNDAVFLWDNGDCSTAHYMGCLGSGFKIESVGDYNGDGKEDLLLREYDSGWGGVGYWASADASKWTDLNARIETNMESKFAVIA